MRKPVYHRLLFLDMGLNEVNIFIKKSKPKASKVLDTYWKFACERQEIFFKKLNGETGPWTNDEVLIKHKFTNVYRACDRVSQYLIKNVIYNGEQKFEEVLFRTLLFKLFNKIDTWELLKNELGEISINNFEYETYARVLFDAVKAGETIYSGAYIMASGKSRFGHDFKFQNHLKLVTYILDERLHEKVINCKTLEDLFTMLKSFPSIGNFLAYQFAIDLNYSSSLSFSEMDFVMPGPGAKDGIRKCFTNYGDYSESDIIRFVTDMQLSEFDRLNLNFQNIWGRELQLIDCQNLFCEVDKYSRVIHPEIKGLSERKRIKQIYVPKDEKISYFFPPKWGLNSKIENDNGKREKCVY